MTDVAASVPRSSPIANLRLTNVPGFPLRRLIPGNWRCTASTGSVKGPVRRGYALIRKDGRSPGAPRRLIATLVGPPNEFTASITGTTERKRSVDGEAGDLLTSRPPQLTDQRAGRVVVVEPVVHRSDTSVAQIGRMTTVAEDSHHSLCQAGDLVGAESGHGVTDPPLAHRLPRATHLGHDHRDAARGRLCDH